MSIPKPPEADRAFLRQARLLYVEDDPITRAVLKAFLKKHVGTVFEAGDGAQGLALWESERPDLVLTDIAMPGMDGLAMAAELRRRGSNVPIIVSTAYEEVEYLRRSIELGVDRFVTKPADWPALEAVLLTVARRLRAEEALAREHRRQLDELHKRHLESIGVMAGGMAHDFNNLLQSVCGGIALAQDLTGADAEVHELLAIARASAEQAATLSTQLVTLSRLSVPLQPAPLAPILARSLRRGLEGSEVQLDLALEELLPEVPVEASLLERALVELVRNACEAMGGRGMLYLNVSRETHAKDLGPTLAAGSWVVITLRDEGPGIAPELLPTIFEPYVSTKERGNVKGIGLGLSLCRAILHKHHGDVTAESADGAVFRVYLPTPQA